MSSWHQIFITITQRCETTDRITIEFLPLFEYCKACCLNRHNVSGFNSTPSGTSNMVHYNRILWCNC